MGEIKFRAWDKCEGFMIDIKHFGFDEEGSFWYLLSEGDDVPYFTEQLGHSFELMQYTGLKDKNGVEIYEGDVLSGWIGSHWYSGEDKFEEVVKYDEKTASYNFPAIEVSHGDLRVVGNIYENPELLETKKSS